MLENSKSFTCSNINALNNTNNTNIHINNTKTIMSSKLQDSNINNLNNYSLYDNRLGKTITEKVTPCKQLLWRNDKYGNQIKKSDKIHRISFADEFNKNIEEIKEVDSYKIYNNMEQGYYNTEDYCREFCSVI